ncbi:MAG: metal ABC transporter substrate-binding protein [Dehalococcoidia bacterium]|nr:metal ABC transporter substrate-binding protein [Dehalococcoidia bacterium]
MTGLVRLAGLCAVFATMLLALSCGGGTESQSDVVATTVQIGALTREVAGDRLTVHILVGPGVDPHDFEASANDLRQISGARLVLRNGIGLDDFLDRAMKSGGARQVVTVTDGITVRRAADSDGGRGDEDPHVWHNPLNAKVMVDDIVRALSDAYPEDAATFRANGDSYKATLDETDAEIRRLIDTIPPANRKMVTNHDAFGYFIERYGLTYVGAVIPGLSTQGEPSSKEIATLEDTIRREDVKAIFAESSVDPKVAREIARDTGVRIVDDLYGDSLGDPGTEAATLDGMLLANARKIADALR